jgi:ABC-type multidrug transport system fused ATPase/permease subunit
MNDKAKIHVRYIIGILLAIIVILLTVQWGSITNLVAYITFALTVTSIALALVAIIYSMYSNSTFGQNIGTLSAISGNVTETARQLTVITEDLNQKVTDMPSYFKNIEDKTEKSNVLLQKIFDEKVSLSEQSGKAGDSSLKISKEFVKAFLYKASFSGKLVMFISAISFKNNVPFDLNDIIAKGVTSAFDYMYGFLGALKALGLIEFSYNKEPYIGKFKILSYDEHILGLIKDESYKTAKEGDKNYKKNETDSLSWVRYLKFIESYFTKA